METMWRSWHCNKLCNIDVIGYISFCNTHTVWPVALVSTDKIPVAVESYLNQIHAVEILSNLLNTTSVQSGNNSRFW